MTDLNVERINKFKISIPKKLDFIFITVDGISHRFSPKQFVALQKSLNSIDIEYGFSELK